MVSAEAQIDICVHFCVQMVCVDVSEQGRRLRRHIGLNNLQDAAFCWWNLDEPGDELWPWTPNNTQRNNLVLLSCTSTEDLKVHKRIHINW